MQTWSPSSWLQYSYRQSVNYQDDTHLNQVVDELTQLPPLVKVSEIHQLKSAIIEAGRGNLFILQGGDCAESFADCNRNMIRNKINILMKMSIILCANLGKPIVRIGRIAGQYAKPRSSDNETLDGVTLPSYRGDLVNSPQFTSKARDANPDLLLEGYACAQKTIGFINHLIQNEFHTVDNSSNEYGLNFFTSHEALHLQYEQALTRQVDKHQWYNLSTHLPWIGIRTSELDSAHLELLRGVKNPIGLKIGPDATTQWLSRVLDILNPKHEEGRILLITRMGVEHIERHLPPLIEQVKQTKMPVAWSCDPMHGNTQFTRNGIKTRHFDKILLELHRAMTIHHEMNTHLGGMHLELTGEHVTECLGGSIGLNESDLTMAYQSLVDPRLNYDQSIEIASLFAKKRDY